MSQLINKVQISGGELHPETCLTLTQLSVCPDRFVRTGLTPVIPTGTSGYSGQRTTRCENQTCADKCNHDSGNRGQDQTRYIVVTRVLLIITTSFQELFCGTVSRRGNRPVFELLLDVCSQYARQKYMKMQTMIVRCVSECR